MLKRSGFSLVELMIVVVIIGILTFIAVPSYRKHILKTKMAEAYSGLEIMAKGQITYFGENDEFINVTHHLPPTILDPMTIPTDSRWDRLGYPFPIGTKVNFIYDTYAGKINGSGAELTLPGSSKSGFGFRTRVYEDGFWAQQTASLVNCNISFNTAQGLGVLPTANSDWALVYAVGDMDSNAGPLCTVVVRVVEAVPANNRRPGSPRDFVVFNYGM